MVVMPLVSQEERLEPQVRVIPQRLVRLVAQASQAPMAVPVAQVHLVPQAQVLLVLLRHQIRPDALVVLLIMARSPEGLASHPPMAILASQIVAAAVVVLVARQHRIMVVRAAGLEAAVAEVVQLREPAVLAPLV